MRFIPNKFKFPNRLKSVGKLTSHKLQITLYHNLMIMQIKKFGFSERHVRRFLDAAVIHRILSASEYSNISNLSQAEAFNCLKLKLKNNDEKSGITRKYNNKWVIKFWKLMNEDDSPNLTKENLMKKIKSYKTKMMTSDANSGDLNQTSPIQTKITNTNPQKRKKRRHDATKREHSPTPVIVAKTFVEQEEPAILNQWNGKSLEEEEDGEVIVDDETDNDQPYPPIEVVVSPIKVPPNSPNRSQLLEKLQKENERLKAYLEQLVEVLESAQRDQRMKQHKKFMEKVNRIIIDLTKEDGLQIRMSPSPQIRKRPPELDEKPLINKKTNKVIFFLNNQ